MDKSLIILICVIAAAILFCFLLAIANFSGDRFFEKYQQYDKIGVHADLTVLEYIDFLNKKYFDNQVQVVKIGNLAGDAYSGGRLYLSENTLTNNSLASFTIVSHELGHALQDKEGKKLKVLARMKKFLRFFGIFMLPSIVAGAILLFLGSEYFVWSMALFGFAAFLFLSALVLRLITISIEKDASKKAVVFLREVTDEKQVKICKKFLNDARLTYWADFLRILLGWTALSKKAKLFN